MLATNVFFGACLKNLDAPRGGNNPNINLSEGYRVLSPPPNVWQRRPKVDARSGAQVFKISSDLLGLVLPFPNAEYRVPTLRRILPLPTV